jgi:biopolymer transport protein ExbD
MALSLRRKKAGGSASIPTASTGDIAFLILIFFMSTSMFAKEKGLKIVLPEKTVDPLKIPPENILNLGVNASGQVQLSPYKEPVVVVQIPELRNIISTRIAANPDLAIALRVSRGAQYETMVKVFDELKLAKAERVSLVHIAAEDEGAGP